MSPSARNCTALLNGLKLHVHRPPLSLEMVSVPPGLALVAEPLPQAASTVTARPPATASASFLKRLIGVVSFTLGVTGARALPRKRSGERVFRGMHEGRTNLSCLFPEDAAAGARLGRAHARDHRDGHWNDQRPGARRGCVVRD